MGFFFRWKCRWCWCLYQLRVLYRAKLAWTWSDVARGISRLWSIKSLVKSVRPPKCGSADEIREAEIRETSRICEGSPFFREPATLLGPARPAMFVSGWACGATPCFPFLRITLQEREQSKRVKAAARSDRGVQTYLLVCRCFIVGQLRRYGYFRAVVAKCCDSVVTTW